MRVGLARSSSSSPTSTRRARARGSKPGPPAAGPAVEQLFLPAKQPRHAVEVGACPADPFLDALELLLELVEIGPRRPQRRERIPRVALELLREIRDDEPTPLGHLAGVGELFTGKDAKQRRLAAAVRADHAHPDAGLDVEVEPVEDQPRAEALGDAACGEQSHREKVAAVSRRRTAARRSTSRPHARRAAASR